MFAPFSHNLRRYSLVCYDPSSREKPSTSLLPSPGPPCGTPGAGSQRRTREERPRPSGNLSPTSRTLLHTLQDGVPRPKRRASPANQPPAHLNAEGETPPLGGRERER